MENNKNLKRRGGLKYVLLAMILILITYFFATHAVTNKFSDFERELSIKASEQKAVLITISELTSRNGADEVTERIIKDCPVNERNTFDQLLSKLNQGLTQAQLTELERLFGRCGSFFSQRKSLMVSRLQSEIELYEVYVDLLGSVTGRNVLDQYQVAEWKNLIDLEIKQSTLFADLVTAQDKIITLLLQGNTAESEVVTTVAQEANQIQESLAVARSQAANIRSNLISL